MPEVNINLPADKTPCKGSLYDWFRENCWQIGDEWDENMAEIITALLTTPIDGRPMGDVIAEIVDRVNKKRLASLPDAEERLKWLAEYADPARALALRGNQAAKVATPAAPAGPAARKDRDKV